MTYGSGYLQRIYFMKRPDLDTEEQALLSELKSFLEIDALKKMIVLSRFDFFSTLRSETERIVDLIVDPALRIRVSTHDDGSPDLKQADLAEPDYELIVEPIAGQYDQESDLIAQSVQISLGREAGTVKSARHYLFYGDLSPADRHKIKSWLINPVESQMGTTDYVRYETDHEGERMPIQVHVGFTGLSSEELNAFCLDQQLAMTMADLQHIQSYFLEIGRDPTITEIRVLDTYWSDHCRHTTFNTELTHVDFPEDFDQDLRKHIESSWQNYLSWHKHFDQRKGRSSPVTLMDLATISTKILKTKLDLSDLDESEEINACSIRVRAQQKGAEKDVFLMFKNETHNHPTEIEPFGGAGTCLGGAIRDPLSGRAYAYQAMRVSGGGDPRQNYMSIRPGKLAQRYIAKRASLGYSSYGNQIGIAAGHLAEYYHPRFEAKRLEAGAIMAAVPADRVRRECPMAGDVVILVGGRTGRDGIGGATGSSQSHHKSSHRISAAEVQKGNAYLERNLQRLFQRPEPVKLIKRCNDFGAGGVSVAIGELADGLVIDLDAVKLKYAGLDGTEIALSESQERMAVVVSADEATLFCQYAAEENLETAVVAKVTEEPVLKMIWQGQTIVELRRDFLSTNGAKQQTSALFSPSKADRWFAGKESAHGFVDRLSESLSDITQCSRRGLIECFDNTVGSGTVLLPLGGKTQLTPEMGMAAQIPTGPGELSDSVSLMACGYDPYLAEASPYHGGYFAVLSALSKILAMGGNPLQARLSLQEYFGKTVDPQSWGQPLTALLGAFDAMLDFGVPAIGGKDSMSGTFENLSVPPSLIAFAVGLTSVDKVISATLKLAGQQLYAFIVPQDETCVVDHKSWLKILSFLYENCQNNRVQNIITADSGGLAVALVKALMGEALGFEFSRNNHIDLFKPAPGSLIVSFDDDVEEGEIIAAGGTYLGVTTDDGKVSYDNEGISLAELLKIWLEPLAEIYPMSVYPLKAENMLSDAKLTPNSYKAAPVSACNKRKPKVLIPVLPGTNSENDLASAFYQVGAEVDRLIFRNRCQDEINDSLVKLKSNLNKADILTFPGSAEGIAYSIFSQPSVAESLMNWLEDKSHLILGIGRGFAELLELGLLPYGKIQRRRAEMPALAANSRGGSFISRTVTTRYMNVKSPWLQLHAPDLLERVPIAGDRGRLIASMDALSFMSDRSSIAFCYADSEGEPTGFEPWNPTGSIWGIEGLISPDGRILGKFAQIERIRATNSQNDDTIRFNQLIFQSAVKWLCN
ncbi:MAG: phosphoribosylformylglycinamidine synthase [Saccharofermentanales bacterium]|jgi:phosphoribosylformylglycinamidine synthase|nr:phosphoribosylformylglycinamidine synthase [Bacillota bacterium]